MRLHLLIGLTSWAFLASNCTGSGTIKETTQFSRLDSLTDTYLVLHDSLLQSWNRIVRNEMDKTRTLHQLIELLEASADLDKTQLVSFQSRLRQLDRIRFTQKTLANPHVVEEYDKACSTLTNELINLAGVSSNLSPIMQLLEDVQRSSYFHRYQYDSLANTFNEFITIHGPTLRELDDNGQGQLEKKPLFWSVASNR